MVGFADEAVVGGESVGARLRRAREANGLSLDDISARTRVPTRHLKAIEEDAFDQLPAAPYSVGFAKAFADAVGLNRDEIGREFRAEKEGYGAADAMPSSIQEESGSSGISAGWIMLILLVIAAVAGGLWWSGMFGGSNAVETPPMAPVSPPAATGPAVAPEATAPMVSPPVSNEAGPETSSASSEKKSSSETKSEGSTSSSKSKQEGKEETPGEKSSEKGTSSSTPASGASEPAKPAFPSTRDLNLNAQHSVSPAAPSAGASTPAPAAAPPVISPPPPPPPAGTAAPLSTTP